MTGGISVAGEMLFQFARLDRLDFDGLQWHREIIDADD